MTPYEADALAAADLRDEFDAGQSWRDEAADQIARDDQEPRWGK